MNELQKNREKLNEIDPKLLNFIAQRNTLSKQIQKIKKSMGKKPRDPYEKYLTYVTQ